MNVWEAMQQKLVNIYQFLYHVTLVVAFQVKSWSDWIFCWSFKLSSFLIQVLFFKSFQTFPMISKLSPVEVSLFQRKKWPRTENAYYLESGLLKTKKSFCRLFYIEDTGSMVKSRFHQMSATNAFSNLVRIKIKSQEHFLHFLKISESNHQLKIFWLIYLNQNIMVYI